MHENWCVAEVILPLLTPPSWISPPLPNASMFWALVISCNCKISWNFFFFIASLLLSWSSILLHVSKQDLSDHSMLSCVCVCEREKREKERYSWERERGRDIAERQIGSPPILEIGSISVFFFFGLILLEGWDVGSSKGFLVWLIKMGLLVVLWE